MVQQKGLNYIEQTYTLTVPKLAQCIKKLTRLAYPIAHSTLISVLSLEHFIDAIPDGDIRLRLKEVNPKNINEAETLGQSDLRLSNSLRDKKGE